MKRYKLLKDLPTFKAGEEFFINKSGNLIAETPRNPKQITVETLYGIPKKIDLMAYANETLEEFPNILTDWFEEAFAYWDRKLPNNGTTYLIFPNDCLLESGIEGECGIMCFSLDFAKKCLGV